jgi:hypothetical protein
VQTFHFMLPFRNAERALPLVALPFCAFCLLGLYCYKMGVSIMLEYIILLVFESVITITVSVHYTHKAGYDTHEKHKGFHRIIFANH